MKIFQMMGKVWQLVIIVFIFLSSSAYAQDVNSAAYIRNNADGSQTLLNHVLREVANGLAIKVALVSSTQMLDLRVILPTKDPAGLANLIQQLYDPKSPMYHQFLTHQQVVQQFGANTVDSSLVVEQLKSYGLTVYGQSDDGRMLKVSGSVAAVKRAFNVNINNYKGSDGKTFFAPDANPTIPPQIAGKIYAIAGMDNKIKFHPHSHLNNLSPQMITKAQATVIGLNGKPAVHPAFSGPFGTLAPSDILTAYNLNSVASKGSGQTQALFELDGFVAGDITQFTGEFGISPVPPITVEPVNGGIATLGTGIVEVDLDIDLTIAVAPGLSHIFVYEADQNTNPNAWLDEWNQIFTDDSAKAVSCSWGSDEPDTSYYVHTFFDDMALQGQSVFASAGDSGAYDNCQNTSLPPDCQDINGNPIVPVLSVDDPASYQYVTGVGISIVSVNGSEAWTGETASLQGGGGISGSGTSFGGYSWPIPSYQITAATSALPAAMVSTTKRNVPDVVFTADPSTPYPIYISGPVCSAPPTCWFSVWGSSAATPIWAAFLARVNQGRVALGASVIGWFNPLLYQVAQSSRYTTDFHDIISGNNSYYPAKTGFDDATGLGSFNGANLYNDLIGPGVPTGLTPTAGSMQVVLHWTASAGAASYNVKRSLTNGGAYTTVSTSGAVTTTNYTDMPLTNGLTYYYVVSAVNSVGIESANSSQVSAIPTGAVPSAPTGVTAVAGNHLAIVSFSPPASSGSSAIISYTVKSSPGGLTGVGASSPITVTGLTDGTPYTFTATATNGIGTGPASAPSNSVTPNIVPAAPTGVSAVGGNNQAIVSFTAPAPNGGSAILSYTIKSSTGGLTASGASSPITIVGLTNGTAYTFTVFASNVTGPGAVSLASNSVIPAGVPLPPTTISVVAGNAQAIVTFSGALANGSPIVGYTVTSSPGGFTGVGLSSPITVTGLINGVSYTFKVTATNSVGTGAGLTSPAVIPGLPLAPTTVSAVAGDRRATVTFSGAVANGNAILSYTVKSSPGGITSSGASSPITVAGLTNGTLYTFTVTATNIIGTSTASVISGSVTPAGIPVAPTAISAAAGNTQATVTFSGALANGSVITGYTVTSSPGGRTGTGVSSPITVTGLTNGLPYTFTVTATNGVGTGLASAPSNSVTPSAVVSPSVLSGTILGAKVGGQIIYGGVSLTWKQSTGPGTILQNKIYRATGAGPYALIATIGASTSYIDKNLIIGTIYNYELTAVNALGESVPSNVGTVNY